MRINTNSKTVTLDKKESERLWQARNIVLGLAKHADDELQKSATEAAVAMEKVITAIDTQKIKQKSLLEGAAK
jgi:hypothetical protein